MIAAIAVRSSSADNGSTNPEGNPLTIVPMTAPTVITPVRVVACVMSVVLSAVPMGIASFGNRDERRKRQRRSHPPNGAREVGHLLRLINGAA